MKYCTKCVMPDTRPGIHFNEDGICQACLNYEKRKEIDRDKRFEELRELCERHKKGSAKGYDCLIAVSGGKDSHFQVHVMKEKMGMNPLLVTVEDNFPMTEAGRHNLSPRVLVDWSCDTERNFHRHDCVLTCEVKAARSG